MERLSKRWIAIGAISIVGSYWLVVLALNAIGFDYDWLPYAAQAIAASAVGAIMMMHSPFRPWREPVIAAALGVGVMALLFVALPHETGQWVAVRSGHPWLLALGLAAISATFAMAGAILVRRTALARPSTAAVILLSGVVLTGVSITLPHALMGLGATIDATP